MKTKRYHNPHIENLRRSPKDLLALLLGKYDDPVPLKKPPKDFTYPQTTSNPTDFSVTWINHSTFLIKAGPLYFLTDPIYSDWAGPLPYLGPKRRHPPGISLDDLPPIDIVLVSHNHYDHMDSFTIKELHRRFSTVMWIVPEKVEKWFYRKKLYNVHSLSWWKQKCIEYPHLDMQITIWSVPAQHNSGRFLFDMNRSLWMGFVVHIVYGRISRTFYFVGDTAYNPYQFKEIRKKVPQIDLCLCPIGTYSPGKFMRTVHSSPSDAVNIHKDVGAKFSIGMHWKTFKLSFEPLDAPPYDLYLEMKKQNLDPKDFIVVEPGIERCW